MLDTLGLKELLACLLTRHHSGFVRERYLPSLLSCDHPWVTPFVVSLVGEYVIEIIRLIRDDIHRLDPTIYRDFLMRNPAFHKMTKERVMSYWNCYHSGESKEDYAGFQILEFFDSLTPNLG